MKILKTVNTNRNRKTRNHKNNNTTITSMDK